MGAEEGVDVSGRRRGFLREVECVGRSSVASWSGWAQSAMVQQWLGRCNVSSLRR